MKRHAYIRATRKLTHLAEPIEIIAGVELNTLETVRAQYNRLHGLLARALTPAMLRNYADDTMAAAVELAIQNTYGAEVSYFIEVGRGTQDEYVQVFAS